MEKTQFKPPHRRFKTHALLAMSMSGLTALMAGSAYGQIWTDIEGTPRSAKSIALDQGEPLLVKSRKLHLSLLDLEHTLRSAPLEQLNSSDTEIDLPLPHGGMQQFTLYNSPILGPALARKRPDIQTYKIIDPENPQNQGRLDLTSQGFHGVFTLKGRTIYIDPADQDGVYQSYYKSDYLDERSTEAGPKLCSTGAHSLMPSHESAHIHMDETEPLYSRTIAPQRAASIAYGANLRTFKLAVAATGEYSAALTSRAIPIDPEDQIVTTVNRINAIFEPEAAIRLVLEDTLIFDDGATDPFSNDDAEALIDEVFEELDRNIGLENFDIGHGFATGIGGGFAQLGATCSTANHVNNNKAAGVSGFNNPTSSIFYVDILAHEIGHQFGAAHSFNGTASNCGGGRSASSAYEPASGSTIMAYGGVCASENLQNLADDYFHSHSLQQISDYLDTVSCGETITLANNVPSVEAGADHAIPISTPFTLIGSASDLNSGDTLSYSWEQYDLGGATSAANPLAGDDTGPIFRSFEPVPIPSRTFPQLSDILSNTTSYGEVLPTITRNMNFRFTVRDGNGGVASDDLRVQVTDAAGPFTVDTPAGSALSGASTATLEWDVANTTAAPINCAFVDIDLSTDGGLTFPTRIASNTPNDGSQAVTVPNGVDSTTARLRVSCTSQPFFAINPANFTLTNTVLTNTPPVAQIDSYTVDENSAATTFSVLNNDTDTDGNTLSISSVGATSRGGTATISGIAIRYQPAANVTGTETFTYIVSDGNGGQDTASVTVTIRAINTGGSTASSSGGGGGASFGLLMLMLLGLGRGAKAARKRYGRAIKRGI